MSTVDIIGDGLVDVEITQPAVVDVDIISSPVVDIDVFPGGLVLQGDASLSIDSQLVLGIVNDYLSPYKTFTYSGDNLTQINYYNDNTETIHLRRITLGYTGTDLTQKVAEDIRTGRTLTTTFTNSGGNLTVISNVFSG